MKKEKKSLSPNILSTRKYSIKTLEHVWQSGSLTIAKARRRIPYSFWIYTIIESMLSITTVDPVQAFRYQAIGEWKASKHARRPCVPNTQFFLYRSRWSPFTSQTRQHWFCSDNLPGDDNHSRRKMETLRMGLQLGVGCRIANRESGYLVD